jgi:uncharacterized repeat protein (TIGR01451 family)
MKRFYLLLSVVALPLFSFSQCYEIQQRPYYPDPYSGGNEVVLTDDEMSDTIDIGFPFCFFGDTVSQLLISSNGYLTFNLNGAPGGSAWSINDSIPFLPDSILGYDSGMPVNAILGPWQDINPSEGGEIRFATYGVPPYRRFVASYDSVPMFSCTQLEFTNQIVIHESLNIIDINIANKPLCSTWNDGLAIEGIQNQDGTVAHVVPGRNYPNQWTAQYDSYRFVPVCDCPTDSLPDLGLVPGRVYWDQNNDCVMDLSEPWLPHVRIDILPGNGSVWTNQNGEFAVMLEPDNYTFEHSSQNPWYFDNLCQTGGVPVTVVADSNSLDVVFGDTVAQFIDLDVSLGCFAINACFFNQQNVNVCNNGTLTAYDIDVSVEVPVSLGSFNFPFPITQPDSIYEFEIDSLGPGECINFPFQGLTLCDSSMIGQVACFSATVSTSQTDLDTTNNYASFCDTVGTSYDPNDIRVLSQTNEQGWRNQEYIDDDDVMTYMVRFQNTGTGPAFNVIVKNPLSSYLDHQSIELVAASHDHYMQMIDGELSVHFLGIQLPDSASDPLGSQGYFIYKVRQPLGNPLGTLIENQAEIYFDFNAPVATNTTENEILALTGIDDFEMGEIRLYPNPTTGELFITNSSPRNAVKSVEVIDTQGRLLLKQTGAGISKVDLGSLSTGIYLLRIQSEKGILVERVIRN